MTDDARRILRLVRYRRGVTVEALCRWLDADLDAVWIALDSLVQQRLVWFAGRYIEPGVEPDQPTKTPAQAGPSQEQT